MPSFKDTNGKEWSVKIDAPKIREVRSICSLDLVAQDGSAFQKLADDVVLLVDTLWVLCREQANGVTECSLALVGDAIEAAAKALTDAMLDFLEVKKRMKAMFALTGSSSSANDALALANGAGGGSIQKQTLAELKGHRKIAYKAMLATRWLAENLKRETFAAKMGR
jgi:hypothetical protein